MQPFVADRNIVQQGYLTSEPYAIQKAGVKANVFLFADHGLPPYTTTVSCMDKTVKSRKAVWRLREGDAKAGRATSPTRRPPTR